ncbi:Atu4866 domain-containing protein [Prosthecomicrobium pneumaticum]|uniref:Uncharacterized protein n=1 Tax=Prosthecomicrobium pneumaticum TaxID=81895 RepID=A0A7W9CT50_9HYPH|nr:Atu4866 domain-containing protein [Prosthecomicrobium pneumaticum]MBB5751056.1 hypothetical protein [Prosthecomicrobium pneumaticum]
MITLRELCLAAGGSIIATAFERRGGTKPDAAAPHGFAGLWMTEDGAIRHELLPNGRYIETRDRRRAAYRGRYWVDGRRILYLDDSGFEADGTIEGDRLHHAGLVMRRRR